MGTQSKHQKAGTRISGIAFAIAAVISMIITVSGFASGVENAIRDSRDQLRMTPASGQIAIVEIDGRSLLELEKWPWPRRHYADAIKELDRLGAEQIAFDVDFSSSSNPQDDRLLAQAINNIGQPVILPTFRQLNQTADGEMVSEALPIPELQENTFLASVNVFPSADGKITFYPNGVTTNGTARPSLPNMLAKQGGEVGVSFRVDQAIDVSTIPRISFVDLIERRVARRNVAGKRFVFGATAIELGDRYPTALFGVQPGVVIQAQAAETLLQDRVRGEVPSALMLLVLIPILAIALYANKKSSRFQFKPIGITLAVGLSLTAVAMAFDQASWIYLPIAGPILFLSGFVGLERSLNAAADLKAERMTDIASGLANRAAMDKALKRKSDAVIVVARMADFIDVMSVVEKDRLAALDGQIVNRLGLLAGHNTVYRLDSGLFGWLIEAQESTDPESLFAGARALFTAPIEIDNERFRINANFGHTQSSIDGAIFASADARKRGLVWSSNTEDVHEKAQFRQRILGELADALHDGAISVVYQPKLRIKSNTIDSAECLVRWFSTKLGHISPAEFIPILEARGRIDELTRFVLMQAIGDLETSREAGFYPSVAVNISAQLLSDDSFLDFATTVIETLDQTSEGGITLEITESAPLVDSIKARQAVERLQAAGARISIDDYGTGQATLNYLQDFPAQELKLDQSFIRSLIVDRKDRIMVQSTLELAKALQYDVVAEGVEDEATLNALREMGCDYAQGWHIGKPMLWDEFTKLASGQRNITDAA
ncbi:EAL domain-containing protein [Erythrobacter insulae]|uniref:EAL domain-containing protein n=1 Tax=Erythrobacter insulae TaxID=2584124 RepID=UPI00163DD7DB|nr:EAL domain-containing protein [Erythrobacter insulae]